MPAIRRRLVSSRVRHEPYEHAFVSIKGSPSRRLQQALETGNPLLVRTAAAELPRVGLPQTLPNGYCGLPLQQRCPHPNACLTCDSFLTTEEFLPQHREQLDRTRELIASARASGNDRLVDMNEPIELNLVRIIQGLNTLQEASSDAA